MPALGVFAKCLAEALCSNGLRALAGILPLGTVAFEVVESAVNRFREARLDKRLAKVEEDASTTLSLTPLAPEGRRMAAGEGGDSALVERIILVPVCDLPPSNPASPALWGESEGKADKLAAFLAGERPGFLPDRLTLDRLAVGDAGLRALAASSRLAEITSLSLVCCAVTDDGVRALVQSPHAVNLARLDLWGNDLSDAGVAALAESPHLTNLEQLDLGRNRFGDAGMAALAASPYLSQLRELLFVSNLVGDAGALALARSESLAGLAWLKPLDNPIGPAGASALKAAFGRRVRIL